MLTQAYSVVRQIQSQISDINTLQDLKSLLRPHKASLTIQIDSPTLWMLDWDLSDNSVSGTLELNVGFNLIIGEKSFPKKGSSFRLQDPNPNSLVRLEARLIGVIKQFVEDIWTEC
jgi:hypothetical protein